MSDDEPAATPAEPPSWDAAQPLALPEPPRSSGWVPLTLRILRERGWVAVQAALPALALGTALYLGAMAMLPGMLDGSGPDPRTGLVGMLLLVFAGVAILAGVASGYLGLLPDGGEDGEPLTWRDAAGQGPVFVPRLILTFFLMFLALLPVLLLFGAVFAPAMFSGGGAAALLLAVPVLGLPLLLLYARWFLVFPLIVAERRGALEALIRSWNLISGRTWRLVAYLVVLFVLSAVVQGVAAGIAGVMAVLPGGTPVGMVFAFAVNAVVTLLDMAFSVAVYLDAESREPDEVEA